MSININDIKQLLESKITDGHLTLRSDDNDFSGSTYQLFRDTLDTYFGKEFLLEQVPDALSIEQNSIRFTAKGKSLPMAGMNVEVVFRVNQESVQMELKASQENTWHLSDKFPKLGGTMFRSLGLVPEDSVLWVNTHASSDYRLRFEALVHDAALDFLSALWGGLELRLSGVILMFEGMPAVILSGSDAKEYTFHFLKFRSLSYTIEAVPYFNTVAAIWLMDYRMEFNVTLGKANGRDFDIPMQMRVNNTTGRVSFRADLNQAVTGLLNELAHLVNGADIQRVLPEHIDLQEAISLKDFRLELDLKNSQKPISFVTLGIQSTRKWELTSTPHMSANDMEFFFRVDDPLGTKALSGGILGSLDLGNGAILDSYAYYPEYTFGTGLREGTVWPLSRGVAYFTNTRTNLPHLDLHHLNISGNPKTKEVSFSSELTGKWAVTDELMLEGAVCHFDKAGANWTLDFGAIFNLHNIRFGVQADYHTGDGLTFRGSTEAGSQVPLGELLAILVERFAGTDVNKPDLLDGLTLQDLTTSFNTQTKNFTFGGEANFPIASGKTVLLRPHIALTRQQDNAYRKEFAGHLEIPLGDQTLKFDLIFDKSNAGSLMLGAYHNDNPVDISLRELLEKVGIGGVPDVLKIRLREAALAHQKNKNGDNETTQNLFTAHVDGGLNLSALPLVGKMFPAGESITLQVQLLMASANFSKENLAQINALLPEGISHLQTDEDITQGTHLEAKLQVADDLFHLDLPVAVNEKPEVPNPNDPALPPEPLKTTADSTDDGIKWFTLQKNLGPVHFNRIGLGYSEGKIKAALDASFALGGLTISLDGLSVSSPLTKFSPSFDLKGLGIDYHNDALEIGGAFLREQLPSGEDEYDGTAILKMEEFSLGAIGSYTKREGHPSLFIFATLDAPLGGPPYFFVKGLSAGFGYNRALRMPKSAAQVLDFPLVAEAMQGETLPAGAGKAELTAQLDKIHEYIPPAIGQMFLAAGIHFTSFELVESSVLLAASFGNRFELDLLGVSTLVVPPAEAGGAEEPLAVIQMGLKGAFIPEEGSVGLMGVLTPQSYILSKDCHLTGGFAMYSWLKGEHAGDFVITKGGYHPAFAKPAHYPSVPRLGFNWAVDSHTTIKGGMYQALCAHALMVGGNLEATYHNGNLKAWLKIGADFLISWKPYHYDISLYIDIGASYTYHFFGTHHITVDLGADLHLWGPKFAGHARIHIWIVSIGVSFGSSSGKTLQPISWEKFKEGFLPKQDDKYLSVNVKDGLVSQSNDKISEVVQRYDKIEGYPLQYRQVAYRVVKDMLNSDGARVLTLKDVSTNQELEVSVNQGKVTIKDVVIQKEEEPTLQWATINPKHFAIVTDGVIPAKEVTWGTKKLWSLEDKVNFKGYYFQHEDIPYRVNLDGGWKDNGVREIKVQQIGVLGVTKTCKVTYENKKLTSVMFDDKTITTEEVLVTTWNTHFGIAPMDKSADKVSSSQTIRLTREGVDYTEHLSYKAITKKVPAAMWGQKLRHGLNDDRFVDNTFAGLEITAKESIPGHSKAIDREFVTYETTMLNGAIGWEDRTGFSKIENDSEAKDKINGSIVNGAGRDQLLKALGLENATIDLNNAVAGDFVLAPQVEAA